MLFESKINGSLDEEFKSLEDYSSTLIKKLKFIKNRSMIMWGTLTIAVSLANIALIVLASIALDKALISQEAKADFSKVAPTIAVAALVIISFVLGFSVTIYQGLMRSKAYKFAAERIQYSTLKWQAGVAQYSGADRNDVFKKKIAQIENEVKEVKGKFMFKQALVKILTGGKDE